MSWRTLQRLLNLLHLPLLLRCCYSFLCSCCTKFLPGFLFSTWTTSSSCKQHSKVSNPTASSLSTNRARDFTKKIRSVLNNERTRFVWWFCLFWETRPRDAAEDTSVSYTPGRCPQNLPCNGVSESVKFSCGLFTYFSPLLSAYDSSSPCPLSTILLLLRLKLCLLLCILKSSACTGVADWRRFVIMWQQKQCRYNI